MKAAEIHSDDESTVTTEEETAEELRDSVAARTRTQMKKLTPLCVAFSPDAKYVISCGKESSIVKYNIGTRKKVGVFKRTKKRAGDPEEPANAHYGVIFAVAVSPDQKFIASGGFDQVVKIWNFDTLNHVRGHRAPVYSIRFQLETNSRPSASQKRSEKTPLLSCCKQPAKLRFHVPNEHCNWPEAPCRIPPGHQFFVYDYGGKKQKYCEHHFKMYDMPEDQKERFFKLRVNENKNFEETVSCSKCKKKVHRICVLHVDNDSNPLCLSCGNGPMIYKPLRAPHRNEPKSTAFMMRKLNGFLKGTSISIKTYTTRGTSKIENVVPKHLVKMFHGPLEYKKRAIYLYQKQDSVDVLFFALYCREYQNENGGGGWFVVDYLDSVPFFDGAQKKELYPKILLAYFEFMRSIGILNGFLHADPPIQGDDYVFNIHPIGQTYKSSKNLIKWYRKMFGIGRKEGTIKSFRCFQEECALRKFKSPTDIPLFEGSLWSKTAREVASNALETVMKQKFKEHAKDNFFLELHAPSKTVATNDEETLNDDSVMIDRLKFLDFCQRKNWEFGDLRHAKFSSVALAQWLDEEQKKKKRH